MRRIWIGFLSWVIFTLLATAQASATATVSFEPPNQSVHLGQNFSVDVVISDVSNLSGWNADIDYDPDIIKFVSIIEGPILCNSGNFATQVTEESQSGDDEKSSIILSKEQLESLQDTLQAEYQKIGWRILSVSQPLATEIFVKIEVDDKTALAYSDPNKNRVIFGHAVMCPNLDKPRWKFIDKKTDVLFLMFYKGIMIFPPDLHTNRMIAGCRYSRSLVISMIKQGAIQLEIHEKGKGN